MIDMFRAQEIIDHHGCRRDNVIAMLLDCQEEFRYLPRELLEEIARQVEIPLVTVLGVATFYRGFSLKPVGKHPVCVCTGTACHVLGATKLVEAFERELKIAKGDTTPDGEFSLHTINCPGCCGLAPVVTVGPNVHGRITQARVRGLVKRYRSAVEA
jgi:NADH:ubiquinone oxidoreductase subunit E